ncbi:MAG: hypothetical protein ACRC7W_00760, partial [Fusobacteriaceae bacterium]
TDSFGYKVVEFGSKEIKDLEENSDKSKHNIHIKDDYHIYNLQSYIVADKLIANHANDAIVKRLISTYNNTRTSGAHLLMRCIFDDAVSMYNLYMSKKMNNGSINDEQLIASVVDMDQIDQNGVIFRILKAIGITVTKEHIRELYERVLEFVKNHGSELYRIDHTGKIVMCSHSDPFKDKDFFHYIRDDIFMPIFIQASDVFSGLCRISDIARSLKEMRHNL